VSEQDDLIGDLIAEVARSTGIAISRDDPVIAVVLLNQIVLRRYLEEAVARAADAMRDATNDAVRQIQLRYCARPTFALARLERIDEQQVIYRLPRTQRDGTTALSLTPLELIDHLAAQLVHRLAATAAAPPSRPRRAGAPPCAQRPSPSGAMRLLTT
jgi:hypothetical protein